MLILVFLYGAMSVHPLQSNYPSVVLRLRLLSVSGHAACNPLYCAVHCFFTRCNPLYCVHDASCTVEDVSKLGMCQDGTFRIEDRLVV